MSPSQYSVGNLSLRAGLALVFFLLGFVFPLSFALAGVIAISVYVDRFVDKPDERRRHAFLFEDRARHVDWQGKLKSACDSPAETAFLVAMIEGFDLKPKDGRLSGGGITLDLQVAVERYRLDFLVNQRLVVEIDGAAYHSSPEAVAHDRKRDAFLRDEGYEVLRIPAKYPLYIPGEAVDRVRQMLPVVTRQDQERAAEITQALQPARVFGALRDKAREVNRDVSTGLKKYNEGHDARRAQIAANAQARVEETRRRIEAELDADPELRRIYESLEKDFR